MLGTIVESRLLKVEGIWVTYYPNFPTQITFLQGNEQKLFSFRVIKVCVIEHRLWEVLL